MIAHSIAPGATSKCASSRAKQGLLGRSRRARPEPSSIQRDFVLAVGQYREVHVPAAGSGCLQVMNPPKDQF